MDPHLWLAGAARCIGMGLVAPFFSSRLVPLRLRLGLLGLLAVAGVRGEPLPETTLRWESIDLLALAGPLGSELLVGALLGWSACLTLAAVRGAAALLAEQLGLPGVSAGDGPGLEGLPMRGLYDLLALFLFLSLDLHLELLAAVAHSFDVLPPGSLGEQGVLRALESFLAAVGPHALHAALLLAFPVAASLLLATAVQALLTRVVPDLDYFAFGLALRAAVGLSLVWGTLPLFAQVCQSAMRAAILDGQQSLLSLGG